MTQLINFCLVDIDKFTTYSNSVMFTFRYDNYCICVCIS